MAEGTNEEAREQSRRGIRQHEKVQSRPLESCDRAHVRLRENQPPQGPDKKH